LELRGVDLALRNERADAPDLGLGGSPVRSPGRGVREREDVCARDEVPNVRGE
jgi:hypothetical protein